MISKLALTCLIFLIPFHSAVAETNEDLPQLVPTPPPHLEVTHQLTLFDNKTNLPLAGYVYLNNRPLVQLTQVQDSAGRRQMSVINPQQAIKMDKLFQAISPNYTPRSAFSEVVAISGPQSEPSYKELIIVDYSVAGFTQTERGYVGRSILDEGDLANVKRTLKSLNNYDKEHELFVRRGNSFLTLKRAEDNLRIGDIIEMKKPSAQAV